MSTHNALFLAIAICVLAALAVPTMAITIGEDEATDTVTMTPADDQYATIEDGELTLDIGVYDNAKTSIVEVFTIDVAEDTDTIEGIWIEHDVEGVTFYAAEEELSADSKLEPTPGETITVGMTVDTTTGGGSNDQFTIHVEYEDDAGEEPLGIGGGQDETETTSPLESNLTVTDVEVESDTIDPGEDVAVTATIENTGTETGETELEFAVGGAVVETQPVTLDPGEETTVTFSRTLEEGGEYELALGTTDGDAVTHTEVGTVTVADEPTFEVLDRSFSSSSAAAVAPAAAIGLLFLITGLRRRELL